MIFWRGWGISVLYVWVAWMLVVFGIMIAAGGYEPDEAKAAAYTDRVFALWFALSAASVFFLARYRDKTPPNVFDSASAHGRLAPHTDEFMFIRMKYWTHILAAGSLWMITKSFFE